VEASSFVVNEATPAPSPVALFCRANAVWVVFDQIANWTARNHPGRPTSASDELRNTTFYEDGNGGVEVVFTLQVSRAVNEDAVLGKLHEQFGSLLELEVPAGFPFPRPRDTLLKVHRNRGAEDRQVAANLVFPDAIVLTRSQLAEFESFTGSFEACGTNHMTLATVVQSTLTQHTSYVPRGRADPGERILPSASVRQVVTNQDTRAWVEGEGKLAEDPNFTVAEAAQKLSVSLGVVNKGPGPPEFELARDLLCRVMKAVVLRACAPVPQQDSDSDDDEAGELDDEVQDEEDNEEDENSEADSDDDSLEGGAEIGRSGAGGDSDSE